MRLALADVKKTIQRRDGTVYVTPYLLRPRERERELTRLIALFEGALGQPRDAFPSDLPAEIMGDYRLARCLIMCLGEWYAWEAPEWARSASEEEIAALAARGVTGPAQLRLALYDGVSRVGGYLAGDRREATLTAIADGLGVSRESFDRLLYLDAEGNATVRRLSAQAPGSGELRARYNQCAFEALLASSASVELVVPSSATTGIENGRGALVKQVCFLAKRLGVQYDVGFAGAEREPGAGAADMRSLVAEAPAAYVTSEPQRLDDVGNRPLVITLFGPQELVGSPAQYGERLAALCRALLGYRRADHSAAPAGMSGYARVYLHGRPLIFALDDRVLRLVRGDDADDPRAAMSLPGFDSSLERRLHEEFAAYEQAGEAHGWHLEREPEPIIVADTIMIPDFALTRGARRVYLEIAGYWRPEYRERKLRKLRALRGAVSLIVAVPSAAQAEFAPFADDFSLLAYDAYVGARPLLALLDRAFDDRQRRLASLDVERALSLCAQRLVIPEDEALALLRVYTRNERADAVSRLRTAAGARGDPAPEWLDGVGLCASPWLEAVSTWLRGRVIAAEGNQIALPALTGELASAQPILSHLTTAGMESLARRAGLTLTRRSLFEPIVTLDGHVAPSDSPPESASSARAPQPRRGVRRKHHEDMYATHSLFEPETANPDSSPPAAPTRNHP